MHKIVPALIALILVLAGQGPRRGTGSARTNVRPRARSLRCREDPGDYRESAALLESLLADGFRNGAVYYNLGNAYFRAGEYGRSIAAYRKAKPYRPRDPYLEANLRQALSVAPGRLPEPPAPWWRHVLVLERLAVVSREGLRVVRGLSCWRLLAAFAALLFRRPRMYWISGGARHRWPRS